MASEVVEKSHNAIHCSLTLTIHISKDGAAFFVQSTKEEDRNASKERTP
jgi:hypothetical protein